MLDVHAALAEAGLVPAEMPKSFTYNKVREILSGLEGAAPDALAGAIGAAQRLKVRGPLAAAIFIKHHLSGAHDVEVDRIEENEEQGTQYGVLVYAEGELPLSIECLPAGTGAGSRLHYEPSKEAYS